MAATADDEVAADAPRSLQMKLAALEAFNERLRAENLALRMRLARRKSRRSFERRLLVVLAVWLTALALIVGLFVYTQ